MYTLDTNAIIYYLKDDSDAVLILRDIFIKDIPIYISSLTEVELFAFPNLSSDEEEQIEEILQTISIIPLDSRIARIAGFLRRTYRLKTGDSAIAATALFTRTTLITRNVKDFRKVNDLSILHI